MTRGQIFNAINLIIGLLANLIGIGLFTAGIWRGNFDVPSSQELSFVYFIFSALIYVYAWFYLDYSICVTRLRELSRNRIMTENQIQSVMLNSNILLGILALPVPALWWFALNGKEWYEKSTISPESAVVINVLFSSLITQSLITVLSAILVRALISLLHPEIKVSKLY